MRGLTYGWGGIADKDKRQENKIGKKAVPRKKKCSQTNSHKIAYIHDVQ